MHTRFSTDDRRTEMAAYSILIAFLGVASLADIAVGFSLPVLVGLVLPAAVIAFFVPRAGLLAIVTTTILFERFFTLSPLQLGETTVRLYPLDIILLAAFVSVIVGALRYPTDRPRVRFSDGLLLAFFAAVTGIFLVGILSNAEASVATAFSTWKNYVFYGALAFLAATLVRTRADLRRFAAVFVGSVAAATIFILIGWARGEGLWTEFTPLSTSGTRSLAFPHAFYFSMAAVALLLSARWWSVRPGLRVAIPILIVLIVTGIAGSLMRHLWLGVAGALGLGFLAFARGQRIPILRIAVSFAAVATFAVTLSFSVLSLFPQSGIREDVAAVADVVVARVVSIGDSSDESLVWRQQVWTSSIDKFSASPVFGIGFGVRAPIELGDYREYVEVRNLHNSWLALVIQTGFVGLALVGLAVGSVVWSLFRKRSADPFLESARSAMLGVIALQCAVFFSQPYLETNLLGIFFWISLGIARTVVLIRDAEDPGVGVAARSKGIPDSTTI